MCPYTYFCFCGWSCGGQLIESYSIIETYLIAAMRSLLLLCALIAGVSAIFEDQLGEADWKVENLGVVRHAIFQVGCVQSALQTE